MAKWYGKIARYRIANLCGRIFEIRPNALRKVIFIKIITKKEKQYDL